MISNFYSKFEFYKNGLSIEPNQLFGKLILLARSVKQNRQRRNFLIHAIAFVMFVFGTFSSKGAVSITTLPSGGTNISADKAANASSPAYTTLGNLVIKGSADNDFPKNLSGKTFTINAPSGWEFNTSATISISLATSKITSSSIGITTSTITVTISTSGSNAKDQVTLSGIQVRSTEGGNLPAIAKLSLQNGSATLVGVNTGLDCGDLSQVIGAMSKLLITLPGQTFTDAATKAASGNTTTVNTQYTGINFLISKIRAIDQFFNVVTTYSGVKTLSYSGPSGSPSYTTSVSFTSGASTTDLNTRLSNAQTTTITVTESTLYGQASSSLVVSSAILINGPYVQMAKSTGMNVRFRTSFSHQAIVWYGTARNNMTGSAFQSRDTIEHEVVLTGLSPNTKYFYKIGTVFGDTIESSANNYFYTSPVIGTDKDT
jgi:hypothetical protein